MYSEINPFIKIIILVLDVLAVILINSYLFLALLLIIILFIKKDIKIIISIIISFVLMLLDIKISLFFLKIILIFSIIRYILNNINYKEFYYIFSKIYIFKNVNRSYLNLFLKIEYYNVYKEVKKNYINYLNNLNIYNYNSKTIKTNAKKRINDLKKNILYKYYNLDRKMNYDINKISKKDKTYLWLHILIFIAIIVKEVLI